MTWVVGFNAFNGVLCVADVQVTVPSWDGKKVRYFDCLKKVHRLWRNAYVAFSGDVRVALLMIEDLRQMIERDFSPEELFTFEDQLAVYQNNLQCLYKIHAGRESPNVELLFAYLGQPDDQAEYVPALCRFRSPNFTFNASSRLQLDQCGSGKTNPALSVIAEFLAGRRSANTELYEQLFPNIPHPPLISTVKKARTLLTSEAALSASPGVSGTYCSVMAELGWDRLLPPNDQKRLRKVMLALGVQRYDAHTRADHLEGFVLDVDHVQTQIALLAEENPRLLMELIAEYQALSSNADASSLTELPEFVEEYHPCSGAPAIEDLCTTWPQVREYLKSRGIPLASCRAIA